VSPTAIALVLVAALAHASWNLFSKQAATTGAVFFIWLVAAWATALYAPVVLISVLVSRPELSGASWLFMAGTGVLQAAYFLFLQSGYRLGDLSLVYPIGRGSGALLAALAAGCGPAAAIHPAAPKPAATAHHHHSRPKHAAVTTPPAAPAPAATPAPTAIGSAGWRARIRRTSSAHCS